MALTASLYKYETMLNTNKEQVRYLTRLSFLFHLKHIINPSPYLGNNDVKNETEMFGRRYRSNVWACQWWMCNSNSIDCIATFPAVSDWPQRTRRAQLMCLKRHILQLLWKECLTFGILAWRNCCHASADVFDWRASKG